MSQSTVRIHRMWCEFDQDGKPKLRSEDFDSLHDFRNRFNPIGKRNACPTTPPELKNNVLIFNRRVADYHDIEDITPYLDWLLPQDTLHFLYTPREEPFRERPGCLQRTYARDMLIFEAFRGQNVASFTLPYCSAFEHADGTDSYGRKRTNLPERFVGEAFDNLVHGGIATKCVQHRGTITVHRTPHLLLLRIAMAREGDSPGKLFELPLLVDPTLSPDTIRHCVLREIFNTVLQNESSLLYMLADALADIDHQSSLTELRKDSITQLHSQFRNFRGYLYSQHEFCRVSDHMMEHLHKEAVEKDTAIVETSLRTFEQKYEEVRQQLLQYKSKHAAVICQFESTFSSFASTLSVIESQRAIAEAEGVTRLTQLAFFFIPLTFVAGIFGMNLYEFQEHAPKAWIYTVVSLALLFVTYAGFYCRSVINFMGAIYAISGQIVIWLVDDIQNKWTRVTTA